MTDTIEKPSTKDKVLAMLTENTGRAMGDSGGAYGRNWERNQGRNFESEEPVYLDVRFQREGDEFRPEITINLYHWMNEVLHYDAEADARWQAFAAERREDDYEMAIMEAYGPWLEEQGHEVGGIYGEGEPVTVNTYNGECLLSQTLQFVYITIDGTSYVLLQVHGGCDVRGGYTDAVLFEADESALYFTDATIYADGDKTFNGDPYWRTDDGWHWYFEGASPGTNLESYKVSHNPAHKGDGEHVYIPEDENEAYCPLSGLPLKAAR